MRPFWAIVKLTCRNVLRSHIFQLLLLILIMCVAFIPATIQGDGTAQGFIQVSLKFSLFSVALMLALSSVWSGCMIMTQDIDGYQLHMVITKPVSRIIIWLAKATGIFFIHALLLAIASVLVYVVVMARYNAQLVPPDEIERVANEIRTAEAQANSMPNSKERDVVVQKINELKDIQKKLENSVAEDTRIRNEVLVARRRYVPVGTITNEDGTKRDVPIYSRAYINTKAREEFQRVLEDNAKKGIVWDAGTQEARLRDLNIETTVKESVVKYGEENRKIWRITGLPKEGVLPLYLRFRMYVTQVSDKTERDTNGWWFYGRVAPGGVDGETIALNNSWVPLSSMPQMYRTNRFIEIDLPKEAVDSSGTMFLSFINFDPEQEDMFFQIYDGPQVYVQHGGFTMNYVKCIMIIALGLLILCGLGCTAGGFLSMPTAIFFVITYLLFGIFATIVVNNDFIANIGDVIGKYVGNVILTAVIPLQNFEVSSLVADGIMIEWSFIGNLFVDYFLLKALPLFLLGLYLYWRREMGLVIKK